MGRKGEGTGGASLWRGQPRQQPLALWEQLDSSRQLGGILCGLLTLLRLAWALLPVSLSSVPLLLKSPLPLYQRHVSQKQVTEARCSSNEVRAAQASPVQSAAHMEGWRRVLAGTSGRALERRSSSGQMPRGRVCPWSQATPQAGAPAPACSGWEQPTALTFCSHSLRATFLSQTPAVPLPAWRLYLSPV